MTPARDYITPKGYRVSPVLLWHLLTEYAQRHGAATLPELLRQAGVPPGASLAERCRVMRGLGADQVLALTDWVTARVRQARQTRSERTEPQHPVPTPRVEQRHEAAGHRGV